MSDRFDINTFVRVERVIGLPDSARLWIGHHAIWVESVAEAEADANSVREEIKVAIRAADAAGVEREREECESIAKTNADEMGTAFDVWREIHERGARP